MLLRDSLKDVSLCPQQCRSSTQHFRLSSTATLLTSTTTESIKSELQLTRPLLARDVTCVVVASRMTTEVDNNIELRVKTKRRSGLLLLSHKTASTDGDYLAMALVDGQVEVSYNLGRESPDSLFFLRVPMRIDDDRWHNITFSRSLPLCSNTLRLCGQFHAG